jgi:hypothetical protein
MDETRTQLDWDLLDRSTKKLNEIELLMKQVRIACSSSLCVSVCACECVRVCVCECASVCVSV